MDELLALIEDHEETVASNDSPAHQAEGAERDLQSSSRTSINSTNASRNHDTNRRTNAPVAAVPVDEQLGLRMIERKLPSAELKDILLNEHHLHQAYFSPAALSAMSKTQLATQVLIDPPPSLSSLKDSDMVGKTRVTTVGLVFSHSGTRVSKQKGSAFFILSMGSNLDSGGPCITVFVFGDAYSKHIKSCEPGTVILIQCPKLLLPPREREAAKATSTERRFFPKHDTAISFSISDADQLQVVAKARDFAFCKATIPSFPKSRGGLEANSSSTVRYCKTPVDLRRGEYCDCHQRQKGSASAVHGSAGGGSSTNKFQKLRAAAVLVPHRNNRMTQSSLQQRAGGGGGNRLLAPVTSSATNYKHNSQMIRHDQQMKGVTQPPAPRPERRSLASFIAPSSNNSNNNSSTKKHIASNPTKHGNRLLRPATTSSGQRGRTTRPVTTSAPPVTLQKRQRKGQPTAAPFDASSDWLAEGIRGKSAPARLSEKRGAAAGGGDSTKANRKRKSLSTIGGGFDGRVAVPKPSRLFQTSHSRQQHGPGGVGRTSFVEQETDQKQLVKQKNVLNEQEQIAERLRTRNLNLSNQGAVSLTKHTSRTHNPYSKKNTQRQHTAERGTTANAFLDNIQIDDMDKVLHAKSRFSNEVDAERYAQSRHRVVALEEQEAKKDQGDRQKQAATKRLKSEWICVTCGNIKYNTQPKRCLFANHEVKQSRTILSALSKSDQRTKVHEKAAEAGGLQLGAGIEWNRRGGRACPF